MTSLLLIRREGFQTFLVSCYYYKLVRARLSLSGTPLQYTRRLGSLLYRNDTIVRLPLNYKAVKSK